MVSVSVGNTTNPFTRGPAGVAVCPAKGYLDRYWSGCRLGRCGGCHLYRHRRGWLCGDGRYCRGCGRWWCGVCVEAVDPSATDHCWWPCHRCGPWGRLWGVGRRRRRHGRTLRSQSHHRKTRKAATGRLAANGAAPRFIGNSADDLLDTTRVTIPEGKFGYLLKNPSKSGVFKDSMGFDQTGLDSALRSHLTTNFGNASRSVPMTGGGSKFVVRGPLTGPSGQTWNITSAWGVDVDGTIRLITATP